MGAEDNAGASARSGAPDPLYVATRRVLLDALVALGSHRDAVIVAGAQAVYLHTGTADLAVAVAPYTTDGDLALDPELLGTLPELEATMRGAGFRLKSQSERHAEPGIWLAAAQIEGREVSIPVDLIVPEGAASGGGRRAARLQGHGDRAARRAVGLEAALLDNGPMTIAALDPAMDSRSISAKVAGPGALLVAKAHKLHDRVRSARVDRLLDKDAADVLRLMQAFDPAEIGAAFIRFSEAPLAATPSRDALVYLEQLFGRRGRPGIEMAARALRPGVPGERIEALCVAYMAALLGSLEGRSRSY
jgi:hypothetical protein